MLPDELKAEQFNAYPPEARHLAVRELSILQQLPLSYLPLLLGQIITYDWRFPAERREIDIQFLYLGAMSRQQFASTMAPFAAIQLSPDLQQMDWINHPVEFSEKFSAHLWATHQVDAFRKASIDFIHAVHASQPEQKLPVQRLGLAIIGEQVKTTKYRLFRKLRPRGVHFTNVLPANGRKSMLDVLVQRATTHPEPYAHWYIDGDTAQVSHRGVTTVSYNALLPVRDALLEMMVRTMAAGSGPELLRTKLALMRPSEVGLPDNGAAGILSRFQLSLLTEGSGTQIFSTTFVQWAAREALRRAQPLTLLTHYTPRQRDSVIRPPSAEAPVTDPEASLIDADMGTYYTWINQQRLSGADEAAFLAWFEGHNEAVAVGPQMASGTTNSASTSIADILGKLQQS